jgi:hypothetical protein
MSNAIQQDSMDPVQSFHALSPIAHIPPDQQSTLSDVVSMEEEDDIDDVFRERDDFDDDMSLSGDEVVSSEFL